MKKIFLYATTNDVVIGIMYIENGKISVRVDPPLPLF